MSEKEKKNKRNSLFVCNCKQDYKGWWLSDQWCITLPAWASNPGFDLFFSPFYLITSTVELAPFDSTSGYRELLLQLDMIHMLIASGYRELPLQLDVDCLRLQRTSPSVRYDSYVDCLRLQRNFPKVNIPTQPVVKVSPVPCSLSIRPQPLEAAELFILV